MATQIKQLYVKHYSATFDPMPAPKLKTAKDAPLVCVQFSEALVPYLLGLLEEYRWADKLVGTPLEVQQALGVFEHLRLLLATAKDDCEGGEVCRDYPPNSTIIEYAPQDPFKRPDYVPPGYTGPPFTIIQNEIVAGLLALESGDVVTGVNGLPVTTPVLGQGLARFRVNVEGSGTVELHLLTLPFGGMALITRDDLFELPVFIDLVRDTSLVPPSNYAVNIIEVVFETAGKHHVDVTFLPSFGQTALFVGYGGGLRKVNLCGFEPMQGSKRTLGVSDCAVDMGVEMSRLRKKPTDACILQIECAPDEWIDWYDPRTCSTGTVTQPEGEGELLPGACKIYPVTLLANQQWRLPVPVKAGDVITVSDVQGAWTDGGNPNWNCANGQPFVLGQCVGVGGLTAGDPATTVNHMRLVYSVGNQWFDGFNTENTIQAGVVASELTFQANDSALENNKGTVTFKVTVCAAQENAFTTETLTIPATNGNAVPIVQQTKATKVYRITLSGTGTWQPGNSPCDAFYVSDDGTNFTPPQRYNPPLAEIYRNGAPMTPLPAYAASHTYVFDVQGDGTAWTFNYHDTNYGDNSGSFQAQITEL